MKETKKIFTLEKVKLKASMERTYKILEDCCIEMKDFYPQGEVLIPIIDDRGTFRLVKAKENYTKKDKRKNARDRFFWDLSQLLEKHCSLSKRDLIFCLNLIKHKILET